MFRLHLRNDCLKCISDDTLYSYLSPELSAGAGIVVSRNAGGTDGRYSGGSNASKVWIVPLLCGCNCCILFGVFFWKNGCAYCRVQCGAYGAGHKL